MSSIELLEMRIRQLEGLVYSMINNVPSSKFQKLELVKSHEKKVAKRTLILEGILSEGLLNLDAPKITPEVIYDLTMLNGEIHNVRNGTTPESRVDMEQFVSNWNAEFSMLGDSSNTGLMFVAGVVDGKVCAAYKTMGRLTETYTFFIDHTVTNRFKSKLLNLNIIKGNLFTIMSKRSFRDNVFTCDGVKYIAEYFRRTDRMGVDVSIDIYTKEDKACVFTINSDDEPSVESFVTKRKILAALVDHIKANA